MPNNNACPCGGDSYLSCCEPLHSGHRQASTAVELMRSRYSAYAVGALDYVFRTWHPRTRPESIDPSPIRWVGLSILETQDGTPDDATGIVEFIATFTDQGRVGQLHERSLFERRGQRWFYLKESSSA